MKRFESRGVQLEALHGAVPPRPAPRHGTFQRRPSSSRCAQVPTELHVFEGTPHGGFGGASEDQ